MYCKKDQTESLYVGRVSSCSNCKSIAFQYCSSAWITTPVFSIIVHQCTVLWYEYFDMYHCSIQYCFPINLRCENYNMLISVDVNVDIRNSKEDLRDNLYHWLPSPFNQSIIFNIITISISIAFSSGFHGHCLLTTWLIPTLVSILCYLPLASSFWLLTLALVGQKGLLLLASLSLIVFVPNGSVKLRCSSSKEEPVWN